MTTNQMAKRKGVGANEEGSRKVEKVRSEE